MTMRPVIQAESLRNKYRRAALEEPVIRRITQAFSKPQYLFRPSYALKRALQAVQAPHPRETVRLPWGLSIDVDTADTVGNSIVRQGMYDIVTTEMLWRLTAPGDRTIDAGAHVGYMTSLLAVRAGPRGSVTSFEPHPESFVLLGANAQRWTVSPIAVHNVALSNFSGQGTLRLMANDECNKSHSYLGAISESGIRVPVARLSDFIDSEIGVMKLDVQGHEAAVLEGAGERLRNVRDIIFEEEGPYPQASHKLLESAGYRIMWFEERLRGPRVIAPSSSPKRRAYDILPSYLATRDFARAERLLSSRGWHSF